MILRKNKWFMLTEIILGMTVFAIIMTTVLLSVESMSIARIKTENRVTIIEDLYSFWERLISIIKEWWTLDYEEYWNRISYDTQVASGHYILPTWVGNYGSGGDLNDVNGVFWAWLYYCISRPSDRILAWSGCLESKNTPQITWGASMNYSWTYQRYGQYALQFTDWNGNADLDVGDEDTNFDIRNDEDDKDLGNGPIVLSGSMPELYLIDPELKTRTYFRWIVRTDPNAPSGVTCTFSGPNMWSGCVGNVQILKLEGKDLWEFHSGWVSDFGAFDGKIDTWVCHRDWPCAWPNFVALGNQRIATGKDSEWVDIFPDTINVKSIKFSAYPLKNPWLSWWAKDASNATEISPFIHPYVRMQLTIGFAWWKRRTLKDDDPTISINTTVNLGDF